MLHVKIYDLLNANEIIIKTCENQAINKVSSVFHFKIIA